MLAAPADNVLSAGAAFVFQFAPFSAPKQCGHKKSLSLAHLSHT